MQRSIEIYNDSETFLNFTIQLPNNTKTIIQKPMVWLSQVAPPKAKVTFEWQETYCFYYVKHTHLSDEITIKSEQMLPISKKCKQIVFEATKKGYVFTPIKEQNRGNTYTIQQDDSVVKEVGSYVGFGISGLPCFLAPTNPNTTISFTPTNEYILACSYMKTGEFINTTPLATAVQFSFKLNEKLHFQLTRYNTIKKIKH